MQWSLGSNLYPQVRHERNASATRAQRKCDTSATHQRRMGTLARRMRDGWAPSRDGCATGGACGTHARRHPPRRRRQHRARPRHRRTRRADRDGVASEPASPMTAAGGPVRGQGADGSLRSTHRRAVGLSVGHAGLIWWSVTWRPGNGGTVTGKTHPHPPARGGRAVGGNEPLRRSVTHPVRVG